MATVIQDELQISVPSEVTDLDSFLEWATSDEFPQMGRIWWLRGEVWADMNNEQLYSHVAVKTAITVALGMLVESEGLGEFFGDGVLLSNCDGDIAGNPDCSFVSFKSYKMGPRSPYKGEESRICKVKRNTRHRARSDQRWFGSEGHHRAERSIR